MTVVSVLKMALFLLIIPAMAGAYPTIERHVCHEESEPFVVRLVGAFVWGYMLLFATFEVVSVPMILMQKPFSQLCAWYTPMSIVLAVISGVAAVVRYRFWRRKRMKNKRKRVFLFREMKRKVLPAVLWLLFICAVGYQLWFLEAHQHYDGDDAYYVAQSVVADEMDTMYQRDVYNGFPLGHIDTRHALAAFPMLIAWLGEVCEVHPTIMAHTILAPILILLTYAAYFLMAQILFGKHQVQEKTGISSEISIPTFMGLLSVWFMFGAGSLFTTETFLFTRTWQGKSLFGNLLVPLLIFLLLQLYDAGEGRLLLYLQLAILSVVGVLFTTAVVYFVPLVVGVFSVFLWVMQKREGFVRAVFCCLAILPGLFFGLVYYLMK